MKLSGKRLFELGCPQKKIKFLINEEFESEEAAIKLFTEQVNEENLDEEYPKNSAFEFLKSLKYLPTSVEGRHFERPSNSEIHRWLKNKSILINGVTPNPRDIVEFPIEQLIFFYKGKNKCTMIDLN